MDCSYFNQSDTHTSTIFLIIQITKTQKILLLDLKSDVPERKMKNTKEKQTTQRESRRFYKTQEWKTCLRQQLMPYLCQESSTVDFSRWSMFWSSTHHTRIGLGSCWPTSLELFGNSLVSIRAQIFIIAPDYLGWDFWHHNPNNPHLDTNNQFFKTYPDHPIFIHMITSVMQFPNYLQHYKCIQVSMFNIWRHYLNLFKGITLVSMSGGLNCVGIFSNKIESFKIISLIKCILKSLCFVLSWKINFLHKCIVH